jgi:spore germination cell wall hydrolase CwlJ-like protein
VSKLNIGLGIVGLAGVLAVQQYQLYRMTDKVKDINQDVQEIKKFITQTTETVKFTDADEACLARNIYYEAGVESTEGKYSVAQTTINRLHTGRWGSTICSVVHAKAQFSWTLKKRLSKPSGQAWIDSQWVAHRALRGERVMALRQAIFYHAQYVSPKWKDKDAKILQVGAHIFYTKAKTKKA